MVTHMGFGYHKVSKSGQAIGVRAIAKSLCATDIDRYK